MIHMILPMLSGFFVHLHIVQFETINTFLGLLFKLFKFTTYSSYEVTNLLTNQHILTGPHLNNTNSENQHIEWQCRRKI